jgi:uncharacterized protein
LKFTRERRPAHSIHRISDDAITIGAETYRRTVAVTPDVVFGEWDETPLAELTADDLDPLLESEPDILVLGTGTEIRFAPRTVTFALARRGIGLEVMDTRAAARTFNVLLGEGRDVAALLYL